MSTEPATTRVTLELGPQAYSRLTALQEKIEGGTKVRVIQQALQLLEYVVQRAEQGEEFFTKEKDSNEYRQLAILGVTSDGKPIP